MSPVWAVPGTLVTATVQAEEVVVVSICGLEVLEDDMSALGCHNPSSKNYWLQ